MSASKRPAGDRGLDYRTPTGLTQGFYALLVVWTLACLALFTARGAVLDWSNYGQWAMIGFVMAYTWYWSLGVFHTLRLDGQGRLHLTSPRRALVVDLEEIGLVEGPLLPLGFVRLRLAREKAYVLCRAGDPELSRLLLGLKSANPALKFKHIGER